MSASELGGITEVRIVQPRIALLSLVLFGAVVFAGCGDGDAPSGGCDDCLTPPAASCDGDTAITWGFLGECIAGACEYPRTTTVCSFGCSGGVCATGDACEDVCEVPAPVCDGSVRVTSRLAGCEGASCSFDEERVDCAQDGRVCSQGACVPAPGTCTPEGCGEPPEDVCDGNTLVSTRAPVCEDDACFFEEVRIDCEATGGACVDGRCTGRCDAVTCDTPPAPRCEGGQAIVFGAEGTCDRLTGECSYPSDRTSCGGAPGGFCAGGTCIAPPSCDAGCDPAPPPVCDGEQAVRFVSGRCEADVCVFEPVVDDCPSRGLGCFEGVCGTESPCAGIVCDAPPADVCDGQVLVQAAAGGECRAGTCVYSTFRTSCEDLGQLCIGGACVEDPCTTAVCDSPRAPFCRGSVRVTFTEDGTCLEGQCRYPETTEDCASTGGSCVDGACINLCEGITCGDAPPPSCDRDIAVTYSGDGSCLNGRCRYAEARRNCRLEGLFCESGTCVPDSPCRGITCDAPPLAFCEEDVRVTWEDIGTCSEGACSYTEVRTECSETDSICFLGDCVDACAGVACNRPPAARCEDAVSLRTFLPGGSCAFGACTYTPLVVPCTTPPAPYCDGGLAATWVSSGRCEAAGCRYDRVFEDCPAVPGGACVDGACAVIDPCDEVVCETPPAARCEGGLSLRYETEGTCSLGACTYPLVVDDCTAVIGGTCAGGLCVDPCSEVDCSLPPEGVCLGTVAVSYVAPGRCAVGTCSFEEVYTECASVLGGTCEAGRCIDPCEGNACDAPPPSVCDGQTLRAWRVPGLCEAGTCTYVEETIACDVLRGGSCVDGACVTECDGGCDAPPAPACVGDLAYRYDTPSGCESGRCVYPLSVLDCTAVAGGSCIDGACFDPCGGVTCDAPPAPSCDADVARRFEPVGLCRAGVCSYTEVFENCGAVLGGTCEGGVCLNPCAGVTCTTPPAPVCDGGTLQTWRPDGICEFGTCRYERVNVACDELLGGTCVAGACVTECDGGCTTPPEPACEGDLLREYAPFGTCASGRCDYAEVFQDCAAIPGGTCAAGRCIDPCAGIACVPPAPRCDGTLRITATDGGSCREGICSFIEQSEDCASIAGGTCIAGVCVDPCGDELCDRPPDDVCIDDILYPWVEIGECFSGACTYLADSPIDCAETFLGICSGGRCVTQCELGCDDPPEDFCDAEVQVTWEESGCDEGRCVYSQVRDNCEARGPAWRCIDGACVDACVGVVCNDPPPSTCVGGVFTYAGTATCSGGECIYIRREETCPGPSGTTCEANVCVFRDTCDGVVCDSPPANTCVGEANNEALIYAPVGTCGAGECFYVAEGRDCSAEGALCVDGACVPTDTCEGFPCTTPPESTCVDNRAIRYEDTVPASCTLVDGRPTCSYESQLVVRDCTALGLTCIDAECVIPETPGVGAIRITELMIQSFYDPIDGQWFEVENTTGSLISLAGVTLRDIDNPSRQFVLSGSLGAFGTDASRLVFSRPLGAPEGPGRRAWTGTFTLPTGAGGVELVVGTTIIDSVRWDASWPLVERSTLARRLDPPAGAGPADPAAWCAAGSNYDVLHRGTPGAENFDCLEPVTGPLAEGVLSITEIMPIGLGGLDWFEVSNQSTRYLDLSGLTVRIAGVEFAVTGGVLPAQGRVVFASSEHPVVGPETIVLTGLNLPNSAGEIRLQVPGRTLAFLGYVGTLWPYAAGVSAQVDVRAPGTYAQPDQWCRSTSAPGDGSSSTPGTENAPCPGIAGYCESDLDCTPAQWCDFTLLITRVDGSTCDFATSQCRPTTRPAFARDCAESGGICYNRECVGGL